MTRARIDLSWDPDERRRRVRRRAGKMALVVVALLSALSWAETAAISNGDPIVGETGARGAIPGSTQTPPPLAPSLAPTKSRISFGVVPIGSTRGQEVRFRNDGTAAFAANAVAFNGQRAASFDVDLGSCDRVEVGSGCTALAVFRPVDVEQKTASIHLLDVSGVLSGPVTLTGRGDAPPPPRSPPWHHVGFESPLIEVPQGTQVSVVIHNTGEDDADIGSMKVDDDVRFKVTHETCAAGMTLRPGQKCMLAVRAVADQAQQVTNLRLENMAGREEDVAALFNPAPRRPQPPPPVPGIDVLVKPPPPAPDATRLRTPRK